MQTATCTSPVSPTLIPVLPLRQLEAIRACMVVELLMHSWRSSVALAYGNGEPIMEEQEKMPVSPVQPMEAAMSSCRDVQTRPSGMELQPPAVIKVYLRVRDSMHFS